jgi:hypothetical protein
MRLADGQGTFPPISPNHLSDFYSQHGRPVNIQSFGQVDLTQLYKHVSPDLHWETIMVNGEALICEVLPACSAAVDKTIEHSIIIIDLKGFRFVLAPSFVVSSPLTTATPLT